MRGLVAAMLPWVLSVGASAQPCERLGENRVRVRLARVEGTDVALDRVIEGLRRRAMEEASQCGGAVLVQSLQRIVESKSPTSAPVDFFSSFLDVVNRSVLTDIAWEYEIDLIEGGEGIRASGTLEATVESPPGQIDPDYRVVVELGREGEASAGASGRGVWNVREGETFWVRARATRESTIYLYDVDEKGRTFQIFPVSFQPDARTASDGIVRFPEPRLRKQGFRLRAVLEDGEAEAEHRLLALAFRSPPPWAEVVEPNYWVGEPEDSLPRLEDLMSALVDEDLSSWTVDLLVYRVHAR